MGATELMGIEAFAVIALTNDLEAPGVGSKMMTHLCNGEPYRSHHHSTRGVSVGACLPNVRNL